MAVIEQEVVACPVVPAEAIEAFLRSMGDTPTEVEAWMRRAGIRGERGHTTTCAVAMALSERFRIPVRVLHTGVYRPDDQVRTRLTRLSQMPMAVSDFISRFDGGLCPDLET